MTAKTIAELLDELMTARKWSAERLSQEAGGVPSPAQIRRIRNGTTLQPRTDNLESIETALEVPGQLVGLLPRPRRTPHRRDWVAGTWYEHIPAQAGREYETVDIVEVHWANREERRVWAQVERVHSTRPPKPDVGTQWTGVGFVSERSEIFLAFACVSADRPESNGTIAMRYATDRNHREGWYLRFANGQEPPCFSLRWYRDAAEVPAVWSPEDAIEG